MFKYRTEWKESDRKQEEWFREGENGNTGNRKLKYGK